MKGHRLSLLAAASIAVMTVALTACGAAGSTGAQGTSSVTPANAQGSQVQLACSTQDDAHLVDTVTVKLSCAVTGAAATESAFTLHFSVTDAQGVQHTFTPPCYGSLNAGSGTCRATYSLIAPLTTSNGSVSGTLQPDQRPLGPVTPTQSISTTATPGGVRTTTPLPNPKG